jgi:hypothetical protein
LRLVDILTNTPTFAAMSVIKFNVGGRIFATTYKTLTNKGPNKLSRLYDIHSKKHGPNNNTESEIEYILDDNGYLFIDRDPRLFELILNYLRKGEFIWDPKS